MVLSCYFYVSLNLTDILQFPDLAEFRDTAPLSGSCCYSKRHLLSEQNIKKKNRGHKHRQKKNLPSQGRHIQRTKSLETLKNRASIYNLIETVPCKTRLMPK